MEQPIYLIDGAALTAKTVKNILNGRQKQEETK